MGSLARDSVGRGWGRRQRLVGSLARGIVGRGQGGGRGHEVTC